MQRITVIAVSCSTSRREVPDNRLLVDLPFPKLMTTNHSKTRTSRQVSTLKRRADNLQKRGDLRVSQKKVWSLLKKAFRYETSNTPTPEHPVMFQPQTPVPTQAQTPIPPQLQSPIPAQPQTPISSLCHQSDLITELRFLIPMLLPRNIFYGNQEYPLDRPPL